MGELVSHYQQHTAALRAELADALPRERLRELHRKRPVRHFMVAARQFAILAAATWGLIVFPHPAVWIPLSLVQGFTVFDFTVLLHEVVHRTVFEGSRPRLERVLAWLYAVPSGISSSQFTRWHLDHHAELGSPDGDPKRHHLSPKTNARWLKILYATPALFRIYFRAARKESATYPVALQRQIRFERRVAVAAHLAVLAGLWFAFGGAAAVRAYVVPVFFVFPIAFALNRLGQHYDVVADDPAQWSTLVRGHWFWDTVFLNSNYHLEHHYFAGIPFYNLPALQRDLQSVYDRHAIPWRTYPSLVYGWLVLNKAPHTNWSGRVTLTGDGLPVHGRTAAASPQRSPVR